MATKMQQRRGSSTEWANANPILANGEIGFETDTKIIKIGDGTTSWNNLGSPFLPTNGKAADSEKLDGINSTEFMRVSDNSFGRYRGAGDALPTLNLRAGDLYYYAGASQMLMYYGSGIGWRYLGPASVGTYTNRDNLIHLHVGMEVKIAADNSVWERRSRLVNGVATPYWAGLHHEYLPRATIRRTTVQSISGTQALVFNELAAGSTDGMWSSSDPSRINALEAGIFDLSVNIPWVAASGDSNDGGIETSVRINNDVGRMLRIDGRRSQPWVPSTVTATLKGVFLTASDYVVFYGWQNTIFTRDILAGMSVTVERVR